MLMPIQLYMIIRSLVFMTFSVSTWTKEGEKKRHFKNILISYSITILKTLQKSKKY